MWFKRECSCFLKSRKVLRKLIGVYRTKLYGQASQAQKEVRKWSAERWIRRSGHDCDETWGGADRGRSRRNGKQSRRMGRKNGHESFVKVKICKWMIQVVVNREKSGRSFAELGVRNLKYEQKSDSGKRLVQCCRRSALWRSLFDAETGWSESRWEWSWLCAWRRWQK